MWRQFGTAAAAGLTALLLGGQTAQAQDDTFRLGGNIEAKVTTLSYDGQSETTLMRGVRGFVGHGGGHVGFRVGYGGGFYGGYRGGFYRANYGSYGYRPFYGSYYGVGLGYYGASYYSPYYYSPYSYCAPSVYYTTPSYSYYPISDVQVGPAVVATRPSAYVAPAQAYVAPAQQIQQYQPTTPMPSADGTYPYDGGPVNPIPLPKKSGIDTGDGRIVGLPAQQKLTTQVGGTGGFAYPAYGDAKSTTTFAAGRPSTIVIGTTKK